MRACFFYAAVLKRPQIIGRSGADRMQEYQLAGRKTLKIFFFGDSICFGQGVSPQHTWVSRLSALIEQRFAHEVDVLVQNPSVNGNTTRQALERIAYDVQSHNPHIVLTQFGMNDCNVWETDRGSFRVSQDSFRANLSEIVDRCRAFGARLMIIGTNYPSTRTAQLLPSVNFPYENGNRAYNVISRQVAIAKSAVLADAEAAFDVAVSSGEAAYSDLVLADELHLSLEGARHLSRLTPAPPDRGRRSRYRPNLTRTN